MTTKTRMPMRKVILIAAIVTTSFCNLGYAGAVSASGKVVREIAEELAPQIGKASIETTSVQLEKIASKCGNASLDVIEKHGVVALRVFQNAGEDAGPYLVKAIRVYGDDALRIAQTAAGRSVLRNGSDETIRAVARHTDAVIPLIRTYGDECAHALTQLSPGNGRRLIQMVDEKTLSSSDIQKLMGPIGKYGDKAMKFIWEHRKELVATTAVIAFVSDPELYINGAKQLVEVPVKALVDIIKIPLEEIHWNLWVGVVLMFAGLWFLFKRRAILFNQKTNKE